MLLSILVPFVTLNAASPSPVGCPGTVCRHLFETRHDNMLIAVDTTLHIPRILSVAELQSPSSHPQIMLLIRVQ